MRSFRKFVTTCAALALVLVPVLDSITAHAAFNANDIIDDNIFSNTSAMNIGQLNVFLNTFGSSCISPANGFSAPDPTGYSPSTGFTYGSNVSGGQVIYDAAAAYGLNPQVLVVTLQKEQSLVTGGAGCSVLQYTGATGYGCPDGGNSYNYSGVDLYTINGNTVTAVNGTCVNSASKAGFSQQVIHAAWLLKFAQQRSEGNINFNVQATNSPQQGDSWDNSDDPQSCYGGPMTQGTWQTCPGGPAVYYDGITTIDGTSVDIEDGATAALYYYTPHFSGNQNFYNLFVGWFGNPVSPCTETGNLSGVTSGGKVMSYYFAGAYNLAYTQLNNTGSSCAEIHIDGGQFQTWLAHIATAMRSTDPASGTLVPSVAAVDHQEGLNFILYSGAGGNVEIHRMSPNFAVFPGYYDVMSDLSGVTSTTGTFVAGDFLGRGYDQLLYILYNGANGHVEVHMFDPTMQKAIGYYDVVTDLTGVSASTGTFVAGDFLGRGYAQLMYIEYSDGIGHVETHMFNPSLTQAIGFHDTQTNLTGVSQATGTFVVGNFLGRGYGQVTYVLYNGANGMVESHMFNPSLTQAIGYQDIVTNIPSFNPSQ